MSKVKVGDRVRVVVEGTVQNITLNEHVQVCGVYYYFDENSKVGLVSIEVIPEPFVFPKKKWAQVTADGVLWTLTDFGMWANLHGDRLYMLKLTESSNLRVISEGVDDE